MGSACVRYQARCRDSKRNVPEMRGKRSHVDACPVDPGGLLYAKCLDLLRIGASWHAMPGQGIVLDEFGDDLAVVAIDGAGIMGLGRQCRMALPRHEGPRDGLGGQGDGFDDRQVGGLGHSLEISKSTNGPLPGSRLVLYRRIRFWGPRGPETLGRLPPFKGIERTTCGERLVAEETLTSALGMAWILGRRVTIRRLCFLCAHRISPIMSHAGAGLCGRTTASPQRQTTCQP